MPGWGCPMVLAACGEIHGKGKVKNLNVREYRGGMPFFLSFFLFSMKRGIKVGIETGLKLKNKTKYFRLTE